MAPLLGARESGGDTRDRDKDKGHMSNTILTTQNAVIKAFVCPSLDTEYFLPSGSEHAQRHPPLKAGFVKAQNNKQG